MSGKKWIQKFLVLTILFIVGFEIYIHSLKDYVFINSVKKVKYSNVDCLIMGDSHAQESFQDNIKQCVNLSLGGASYPMVADAVYSVENKNKLKYVILTIEPHNFSKYRTESYSRVFDDISNEFKPLYLNSTILHLAKKHLMYSFIEKDKKAEWQYKSKNEKNSSIKDRIKIHKPIVNFEKSSRVEEMEKLISYLINKNIKVIILRTPVTVKYEKEILSYFHGYDGWLNFINRFTRLGANYIDYKELNFDNNNEIFFMDQDHLNKEGSKFFTKLFIEYLKTKNIKLELSND